MDYNDEIWVSLDEAALLEQTDYDTMQKRIWRDSDSSHSMREPMARYRVKTESRGSDGGRELVFVELRSLSHEAQARYKYKKDWEKRKAKYESEDEPWYVGMKLDAYLHEYSSEFYAKTALRVEIEKYFKLIRDMPRGGGTEFSMEYAKSLGIGYKQLRRYILRYREAEYFAERDGAEFYKTLSLCKPPQKGKGVKLTDEMKAQLENLWTNPLYHENLQPFQALYEEFCGFYCKGEYIPSYQTCKRYIDSIVYGRSDVSTLLKDGYQGFRNKGMIKATRDIKSLRVMDLIMGDAHTFDCWVSVRHDNKDVAIRPYLVGFVDARSKVIVGWGICTCPNAEVIKNVLINMMYPKKNGFAEGVPRVIYIDNGKDFTSQELTGRKRTERFDLDRNIKGFYKSVGIEYDKRALPYTPWTKAQIERFFGGLCSRFSKRFPSYTGTLTGSKTSGKRTKDIEGMLKRGELPDIEAFSEMFEVYLSDYHEKVHSTLKADGEEIPTPHGVWDNAERYFKAAPPIEYALSLIGKSCERRVYNTGIRLNNTLYFHELLGGYIDDSVIVRYTDGIEGVKVYRKDNGMKICDAYPVEKLNPLADADDELLMQHLKAQKRQLRRVRDDVRELSRTYEERSLQLPELEDKRPDIVSIPQDKEWREEAIKNSEKRKKEVKREQTDYMRRLADEAFDMIRNA